VFGKIDIDGISGVIYLASVLIGFRFSGPIGERAEWSEDDRCRACFGEEISFAVYPSYPTAE
jgi:hypothetical protein